MTNLQANFNRAERFWTNQRFVIGVLTVMALMVYSLGFRAASFSWFNAVGAASAHVLPGAVVGTIAWRVQAGIDDARLPRWLVHPALACLAGVSWVGLMLGFTYLTRPEIVGPVARAASLSTVVSGIILYTAIALIRAVAISARRLAVSDAARARAELRAVRARVEPHFLYNTLETISGLVRHDPDAAEAAIGRLGRLLRRILDAPDADEPDALVPLSEELTLVRDYLAIEKLRFGDRLQVVECVDATTLEAGIPPLTLQTLAENAVIHGVGPTSRPVTISMAASHEDGKLVIVTSDDGAGAHERAFAEGGVGLMLLRTRLEAHFAGDVRLDVAARPGCGTSVRIAVPAVVAE